MWPPSPSRRARGVRAAGGLLRQGFARGAAGPKGPGSPRRCPPPHTPHPGTGEASAAGFGGSVNSASLPACPVKFAAPSFPGRARCGLRGGVCGGAAGLNCSAPRLFLLRGPFFCLKMSPVTPRAAPRQLLTAGSVTVLTGCWRVLHALELPAACTVC